MSTHVRKQLTVSLEAEHVVERKSRGERARARGGMAEAIGRRGGAEMLKLCEMIIECWGPVRFENVLVFTSLIYISFG